MKAFNDRDRVKLLICGIGTYGTILFIIALLFFTTEYNPQDTFAARFHFK